MTDLDPMDDVVALEQDVGLPAGFFLKLLNDGDDWSFVIKTHALIEAAVSHLLAETVGDRRLLEIFARLELSGVATGKLAFAEVLDCLDSEERRMIRKLSELRNALVHDVSNVDFRFATWISGLDTNQLKNPRLSIWLKCLFVLSLIYGRQLVARAKRESDAARRESADKVREHWEKLLARFETPSDERAASSGAD